LLFFFFFFLKIYHDSASHLPPFPKSNLLILDFQRVLLISVLSYLFLLCYRYLLLVAYFQNRIPFLLTNWKTTGPAMREATKPAHLAGYVELPLIESSSPAESLLYPFHLLSLVSQRHVQSLAIHARLVIGGP
jgi:hypothetical protein